METLQRYSDDANRISDAMNLHAVAKSEGWVIFRLADGRPVNHAIYESYKDAVRGARWDRDNYLFLEIQPDGMQPREAEAFLKYARALHNAGFRLPDPDEFNANFHDMPERVEDRVAQIAHLARKRK